VLNGDLSDLVTTREAKDKLRISPQNTMRICFPHAKHFSSQILPNSTPMRVAEVSKLVDVWQRRTQIWTGPKCAKE